MNETYHDLGSSFSDHKKRPLSIITSISVLSLELDKYIMTTKVIKTFTCHVQNLSIFHHNTANNHLLVLCVDHANKLNNQS